MLYALGLSFLLTALLMLVAWHTFPKLRLLDKPLKYGLTRQPIPYSTGVVMFVVFAFISIALLGINERIITILFGAAIITLTGFIDDFRNLSPKIRLIIQICAAFMILSGGISIPAITNPFGGTIELHNVFGSIILVLWIVGMTNTMNLLDGIPGLVSGVSTIACFVLLLLTMRPDFHVIDQGQLIILISILLGTTSAMWMFDIHPPKVLMGDSGSTFLGFMMAVLAIFAGAKIATAFIVMGFPIFDALLTMTKRIMQKKSPFIGDRQHLHHDLLNAGFTERQTVAIIYTFCALFGLVALYMGSFQKLLAIIVLFIIMTLVKVSLSR